MDTQEELLVAQEGIYFEAVVVKMEVEVFVVPNYWGELVDRGVEAEVVKMEVEVYYCNLWSWQFLGRLEVLSI